MRLPSLLLALALGVGAVGSAGCVVRGRATGAFVYTDHTPPPPRRVVVAARPGWVWVEPYWAWNGATYVWTDGYWLEERPNEVWVQGVWVRRGPRWGWHPGHWRARAHGNVHVRGRVHVDQGKRHEVRDHR